MTFILGILRALWGFWSALPTGTKELIIAIGCLVGLIGLHFADVKIEKARSRAEGVAVGKLECDASWKKSEAAGIEKAKALAAADELQHKNELTALGADYERKLANAKTLRDRDVAAAHAGALVLRFSTDSPSHLDLRGPAAGAPGSDGATQTQLPAAITGNLLALADDADAITIQLASCQAVVLSDRSALIH